MPNKVRVVLYTSRASSGVLMGGAAARELKRAYRAPVLGESLVMWLRQARKAGYNVAAFREPAGTREKRSQYKMLLRQYGFKRRLRPVRSTAERQTPNQLREVAEYTRARAVAAAERRQQRRRRQAAGSDV